MWTIVNVDVHNLWILMSIICGCMSTLDGVYTPYIYYVQAAAIFTLFGIYFHTNNHEDCSGLVWCYN